MQQYKEIVQNIRTRRKELHMKQSELAEKISVSNNHMSAIENGILNFMLLKMEKEKIFPSV